MNRYYVEIQFKNNEPAFSLETVYGMTMANAKLNALTFCYKQAGFTTQIVKKVVARKLA
jgi:hypothetical protein